MAIHEMPMWATKAQGEEILAKLGDIAGVPITVEARTKDGVTVTGQTVYLYEGSDDKGYFIQAAPYNGQPVTFMVRKGMQYFIKISSNLKGHHSPNTVTGFAENPVTAIITYEDISEITTFAAIQAFLGQLEGSSEERVAEARVALVDTENPIEIADTWTTDEGAVIEDPMVVVDVKTWETIDGEIKVGAKLQRKYATVKDIQFDAPEQEEASEPTAEAGLTYWGMTLGQTVPASGNLTKLTINAGDALPYSSYEKIFRNKYNDKNIVLNGHNRYEYSAWRQYLNSSAPLGEWWHRMHAGQMPPAGGSTRGYMAGCSAALLAAVKRVKIPVYAAGSPDGGDKYGCFDYFHLSSGTEFNGSVNTDEGTVDKYWIDRMGGIVESNASIAGRIQRRVTNKTGGGVYVWSRSANRGTSYYVWFVNSAGQLNINNASHQYAGCPACVIF